MERIVRKLLEKQPDRRYQSARELLVDLRNFRRDTSSGEVVQQASAKRSSQPLGIAAAASVAVVAIVLLLARPLEEERGRATRSAAVIGFTDDHGMPTGMTFIAREFEEGRLIKYVHAYEQGSKHRRPPALFGPLK